MFGNKDNSKSNSNLPTQSAATFNVLVSGTTVDGNISTDSDFRIDGQITGDIHCKSKLIIGQAGGVKGNIHCQNAVIEGRFTGKLVVSEMLIVKETAVIDGDVTTEKLMVAAGARFNVTCQMGVSKNLTSGGTAKK